MWFHILNIKKNATFHYFQDKMTHLKLKNVVRLWLLAFSPTPVTPGLSLWIYNFKCLSINRLTPSIHLMLHFPKQSWQDSQVICLQFPAYIHYSGVPPTSVYKFMFDIQVSRVVVQEINWLKPQILISQSLLANHQSGISVNNPSEADDRFPCRHRNSESRV